MTHHATLCLNTSSESWQFNGTLKMREGNGVTHWRTVWQVIWQRKTCETTIIISFQRHATLWIMHLVLVKVTLLFPGETVLPSTCSCHRVGRCPLIKPTNQFFPIRYTRVFTSTAQSCFPEELPVRGGESIGFMRQRSDCNETKLIGIFWRCCSEGPLWKCVAWSSPKPPDNSVAVTEYIHSGSY